MDSLSGPEVSLEVHSGKRLLTSGARESGWIGASVTVPVRTVSHTTSASTVCIRVSRTRIHIALLGAVVERRLRASSSLGPLPGRMKLEYLGEGHSSWWALAVSVARRMGLGRAVAGTWITLLVALLMLVVVVVVSWLTITECDTAARTGSTAVPLRERALLHVPLAAWTCALVACLNAACWSIITPPFQVPDEPNHFAYVQLLAENGQLPAPELGYRSPALELALEDLHFREIRFAPQNRSLASEGQQRKLERDARLPLSQHGGGGAGTASSEPPLYYLLETVPYELDSNGSVLGRLELMRLLSALMAAATALFSYLFVREALPRWRWAWTVGGLAVALFPLLGFISGGVNPDAMLFAVCAALYYCLARAFRRGLTPRLAYATSALTAVGFLTKLNFLGFAPGVILGLVLATRHTIRHTADTRTAWRAACHLAIALAIAASPIVLYALVNLLSNRPGLGAASGTLGDTHGSLFQEMNYIWQLYLPKLPGMRSYFPGLLTTRQLWFNGQVGLYGWIDTPFPPWVYDIALIPAALLIGLSFREILRRHQALRHRIAELVVYGSTGVGVLLLIGAQSYVGDLVEQQEPFSEPRYLLPMLALWGLVVALAVRGGGRRWGPILGTLFVVLFMAHDVFSQLQVIARYYG